MFDHTLGYVVSSWTAASMKETLEAGISRGGRGDFPPGVHIVLLVQTGAKASSSCSSCSNSPRAYQYERYDSNVSNVTSIRKTDITSVSLP